MSLTKLSLAGNGREKDNLFLQCSELHGGCDCEKAQYIPALMLAKRKPSRVAVRAIMDRWPAGPMPATRLATCTQTRVMNTRCIPEQFVPERSVREFWSLGQLDIASHGWRAPWRCVPQMMRPSDDTFLNDVSWPFRTDWPCVVLD